jgi:phospholipid-binding lipoprotein MlaA
MKKSVVVEFFLVSAVCFSVTTLWGENLHVPASEGSSVEVTDDGKVSDAGTMNENKEAETTKSGEVVSASPCINNTSPEVPFEETGRGGEVHDKDTANKGEEREQAEIEAEEEYQGPEIPPIKDSFPAFNRAMFTFNDKVFHYFLKPIYTGYNSMVPEKARVSVRNFYTNIKMPVRFFNCLFQAHFKGAGTEVLRFVINSTVGVAGFFDPAKSRFHLEKQDRDFGQTLGKYKMKPGTYIVWPFIGPSNVRDTVGLLGDGALNPLTWVSYFFLTPIESLGNYSYDTVNDVSIDKGNTYESITKPAIDPYIALQDAYTQNRMKKIKESPDYDETLD